MRIIIARMWPGSKTNRLEDNRFAINRLKFSPGLGKTGFFQRVAEFATKEVKWRHKSIAFLKHSWTALIQKLLPLNPPRYRRGYQPPSDKAAITPDLGSVALSRSNVLTVLTIENLVGNNAKFPNISARHNKWAMLKLPEQLQSAIDREFDSKMKLADAEGWRDLAPEIAQYGVTVTP
jgi:hypothetical protein